MKKRIIQESPSMLDIQGHRGCRGLLPENTIPGFLHAAELGVTTLELDLAITKDKHVVVSHEPYFNHMFTLDPSGNEISKEEGQALNIFQMTYEEVMAYDVGSKKNSDYPDQRNVKVCKPLLTDVFKAVKAQKGALIDPNISFNIEIKSSPDYDGLYHPAPEEFVRLVLIEIAHADLLDRVNLQSFDFRVLEEVKKQSPQMPVAALVGKGKNYKEHLGKLYFKPEIYSPNHRLLSKKAVQELQSKGIRVIPWTVNEPSVMLRMMKMKVDGLITDYPDRLISLLNN